MIIFTVVGVMVAVCFFAWGLLVICAAAMSDNVSESARAGTQGVAWISASILLAVLVVAVHHFAH